MTTISRGLLKHPLKGLSKDHGFDGLLRHPSKGLSKVQVVNGLSRIRSRGLSRGTGGNVLHGPAGQLFANTKTPPGASAVVKSIFRSRVHESQSK